MNTELSNTIRLKMLQTLKGQCKSYLNGDIRLSYVQILKALKEIGFEVAKETYTERTGRKSSNGKFFITTSEVKITAFDIMMKGKSIYQSNTGCENTAWNLANFVASADLLPSLPTIRKIVGLE